VTLLEVRGVTVAFGGVRAVDDVSFAVPPGDLVGLIGPNGAGKTTLLRAITGAVRPRAGRVLVAGRDVTRLPVHRRVRLGLGLSHQIVRPLRSLSALDNVALAAGATFTRSPLRAFLRLDRSGARARARSLLGLVGIPDAAAARPGDLPLGHQKRLEMARALALGPRLLLLDEPLAGLNHVEAARLGDTIAAVNAGGTTTVLIEHNLGEVLRICRRLLVLDQGRLVAAGEPRRVMADPAVRAAYVGEAADAAS
jgi:branched-chain amino acid transport system ATP-binding protein